jgi:hypothetical protein
LLCDVKYIITISTVKETPHLTSPHLTSPHLTSPHLKIYRTIIVPVVLYGSETWSLTLREERRVRVFECRVLRGVLGAKRDEVTGEWTKLK